MENQNKSEQITDLGIFGRRRIKVIGGPTLSSVEILIKDWLQEGHYVKHLQVDHLPQQPMCERWQAIITYYLNDGYDRPPKRGCYRCEDRENCQRYQVYLYQKKEMEEALDYALCTKDNISEE